MWPHGVVIHAPRFNHRLRLRDADKPMLIEALVPKLPVEALDVRVFDRLAGPNEAELDPVRVRPRFECPARKLGPLSTTIVRGKPEVTWSRSRTRTTRAPGNERST